MQAAKLELASAAESGLTILREIERQLAMERRNQLARLAKEIREGCGRIK